MHVCMYVCVGTVMSVAFRPGGNLIASTGTKKRVYVCKVCTYVHECAYIYTYAVCAYIYTYAHTYMHEEACVSLQGAYVYAYTLLVYMYAYIIRMCILTQRTTCLSVS